MRVRTHTETDRQNKNSEKSFILKCPIYPKNNCSMRARICYRVLEIYLSQPIGHTWLHLLQHTFLHLTITTAD